MRGRERKRERESERKREGGKEREGEREGGDCTRIFWKAILSSSSPSSPQSRDVSSKCVSGVLLHPHVVIGEDTTEGRLPV